MQRRQRVRVLWTALIGAIVLSAVIIPLLVTADSGQPVFTATLYSDVIRFEADGVASLRVTIYDLSENELWNSGLVMGDFVDWNRANARGERLANGYYMYLAQGWDAAETLVLNKTGKVVLLPGDQVELKVAPTVPAPAAEDDGPFPWRESPIQLSPMAVDVNHSTESWAFQQVGIGTTDPTDLMHIYSASWNPNIRLETDRTSGNGYAVFHAVTPDSSMFFGSYLDTYTTVPAYAGKTVIQAEGGNFAFSAYQPNHDIEFYAGGRTSSQLRMFVDGSSGNVGIATTSPDGDLDVESTGMQIYAGPSGTKGVIDVSSTYFDLHYGGSNFFGAFIGTPAATLYLDNNGGAHIGSWLAPNGGLEIRRDINNNELVLNEMTVGGWNRLWYECTATDWVAGVDDGWAGGGYYIRDQTHGRSALDITGTTGLVAVHFGLTVSGGLNVLSGTKNFIMDHPDDPSKAIAYAALEGPEAGTYIRGTAELVGGEAVIDLPDHFGMATELDGLTVQLTPTGEWLQLYVVEKSTTTIVVREAQGKSGTFDFLVQGIRMGYADFEVVRDRDAAAGPSLVGGAVSGAGPSPEEEPLDPGLKHD